MFVLIVSGGVAAIGRAMAVRADARWARLQAYAADLGWTEVPREEVPPEIAHLAGWRRPKWILRGPADGDPVWLVWHQWTTRRGHSRSMHNATRLIVARPVEWPDLTVVRRTALGARLMPVRGAGTGDREFDRAYLVRCEPAGAPVVLTPDVRAALVRGDVVPFAVRARVATILVRRAPDADILDTHAAIMTRVRALLSESS